MVAQTLPDAFKIAAVSLDATQTGPTQIAIFWSALPQEQTVTAYEVSLDDVVIQSISPDTSNPV